MKKCHLDRILRNFKNTDPLLYRHIYSQAKRYESLDDLILDFNDEINELRRKQREWIIITVMNPENSKFIVQA